LRSTTEASATHLVSAFRRGLQEAAFIEGQNIAMEYRWADNQNDRIPALAADLVRRQVAVIVGSFITAKAAMALTTTIPIVFVAGIDPVRTGLVTSLNRPGSNVTGVVFDTVELAQKRLGLLHELVPEAAIVAVLLDSNFPDVETEARDAQEAGRAIGRQILIVKAASEREIDAAFAAFVVAGAGALLVGSGPFLVGRRRQLVALAARHALAASYVTRDFVELGGLMSYGPSQTDAYRRGAIYVARILKGENPGDLPVELPTKFDMVINLAAAKALGLDVPPTLLAPTR
jgi:putative ABC transport system substrate-binding protein